MTDGADMDVDGVTNAMTGLEQTGTAFHTGWSNATAAGTGGLGQGPMGAAFLASFRPGAEALGDAAARIARGIRDTAASGHGSAGDYRAADASGGEALGGR
ncbi:hypothetical protein [Amycolatopsis nalaikhensis]|uniref:Excreted virulence factor EspC (Type VII ESX diderm) n=1 Tax=Amycolatopsis nalaikhensis TaxID=715472 RepID=A0ABY8Y1X5_9PSEU|nr:hypothetical protein [Amycolatopsis sp. 2-2]WIV61858.1 hypothetical protein QP939_26240 [Amycolatopsis sp. 2-2]